VVFFLQMAKSEEEDVTNLILDMDETLIHCIPGVTKEHVDAIAKIPSLAHRFYRVGMRDVLVPAGSDKVEEMYAVKRPYLDEFLDYIQFRFQRRIVWSAGQENYVYAHVKHITRTKPLCIDMVWHYGDCEQTCDGIITKPLRKLFARYPTMSANNTLIVDDRLTAFSMENRENGVVIPAYLPTIQDLIENAHAGTYEDAALLQFIEFMEKERPTINTFRTIPVFTPMNKRQGTARILETTGDGDCLFNAIVASAENSSKGTRIFIESQLEHLLAACPGFRTLVSRDGTPKLLTGPNLRLLLVAGMVSDPVFTDEYLTNAAIRYTALPNDPEFSWMAPIFQKTKEPNRRLFYNMLRDRTQYWGDECALLKLSQMLRINICAWIDGWELLFAGFPEAELHLHVFRTEGLHYVGVTFLFDIDTT
jgi:hypothetical protein